MPIKNMLQMKMNFLQRQSFSLIAIFLGSFFLFTVGVAHQEVVSFESRFYFFAIEMCVMA